jgi:threonine synthase
MQAGCTPLVRADNLGRKLGLDNLYIKNDTTNPTGSFKDRVVAVAVSQAKQFGFDTVSCASTGNLANATAAAAAKGRLKCFVFIPADLEQGKVLGTVIYGPKLVKVRGNYDAVNRLCSEIAGKYNWAFVNVNVRPYYAEGSKTIGFETVEQLDWQIPDHVVVPIASGSLLTKIDKSFREFIKTRMCPEKKWKVSGAQAAGCNPVYDAIQKNSDFITPIKPKTIAKSLAIGNPADGYYAMKVIKETGGNCEQATDEEIVAGIRLLAETEGIFAETAGGVTIACLKKMAEKGLIKREEKVVAYVTGNGLKTLEVIEHVAKEAVEIDANLKAFESIM